MEKALAMFQDYADYRFSLRRFWIRSCSRAMAIAGTRGSTLSRRNVFTVTFDTEYAI